MFLRFTLIDTNKNKAKGEEKHRRRRRLSSRLTIGSLEERVTIDVDETTTTFASIREPSPTRDETSPPTPMPINDSDILSREHL